MKKLVLIFLVTLSSTSLYAQKNGVGIKAGASSTQGDFKSEQFVPSDAQMVYHLGVFARFGGVGFFYSRRYCLHKQAENLSLNCLQ